MANYVSKLTVPSGSSTAAYDIKEIFPHISTCETAAATGAKTVTIGNFKLYTGAWVVVKFTNTNTAAASSLTLNVDSTGAKAIKYKNANLTNVGMLAANKYTYFMYDGTNYQIIEPEMSDTKVTQTAVGSTYTNFRPLVLSVANSATRGFTPSTSTDLVYITQPIYAQPSSGFIHSTGRILDAHLIKTDSSTAQKHITFETLFNWMSTTKGIISTSFPQHVSFVSEWNYANSDILQVSIAGTNYEIQLAGCVFEFIGTATAYNAGVFRFRIHSSPTTSFTPNSGYTKFPESTIAEYFCNGSSYSPTWRMINVTAAVQSIATGDSTGQIKVTPTSGSAYNVTVKDIAAGTNTGTANLLAYYSTASKISSTPRASYHEIDSTATTPVKRNIINLFGAGVGNEADKLISGTVGIIGYGDGGPQINFSTSSSDSVGSTQDGAIIFTDHDNAAAGVSWHFVSNQTDWNVISKRFHAKTSMSIGTNLPNTSYNLYVNGTTYLNGNATVNGILTATDHKTAATSHGYYLKDSSGTEYGGVYDNGSNLWIGSTMSTNRHHKGQTYISTGWTGTLPTTSGGTLTGNSSILISVPKYTASSATAGSWDHSAYYVLHSGNFTTTGSGNAVTSVAFDSSTQKLTFTKGSTFAPAVTGGYLPLSGGTMTGPLTMKGEQYSGNYGLNMNNSDIINANRIVFADLADSYTEGLAFYRSSTTYDNFWIKNGVMYFTPNAPTATTNNVVLHSGQINTTGSGNAITSVEYNSSTDKLVFTKGSTFLTAHPTIPTSTDSTDTGTISHGGTFTAITSVTRDSNGHVTTLNTRTYTLPNDTKVNVTLGTTTKAYLLGTSTTPTSSAQAVTSIADTGVYLDTTAGMLTAKSFNGALYRYNPASTETYANAYQSYTMAYYQTSSAFAGTDGRLGDSGDGSNWWAHYITMTHTANYRYILRLPFWGPPQFQHTNNGEDKRWFNFITDEHVAGYSDWALTSKPISPVAIPLTPGNKANKLAFMPADKITIQYSTNGGSSWTDMGTSANAKRDLFISKRGSSISIGPTTGNRTVNMQTRVIIENDGRDVVLDRFVFYLDAGYQRIAVDVYVATASAPNTFVKIFTGEELPTWMYEYTITIPHSESATYRFSSSNMKKFAFVFRHTYVDPDQASVSDHNYTGIFGILGFTGTFWGNDCKSYFANYDHLYNWDRDQNATFPANITSTKFIGPLQGNADTATSATTATNANNVYTTVTNGSTSITRYGIVFAADPNTSENNAMRKTYDFRINLTNGATNTTGMAELVLGNEKAKNTADNKQGSLTLYSAGTSYHQIYAAETNSAVAHTFPATAGTILNSGTTSWTQTVASTATGAYQIGKIKINNSETVVYGVNTDTDTKVTSSANHYSPSTASGQDKTASASGATAAWSIDVVKGVTLNTDGKGHVTGLSVTSGKIPANPTDHKVSMTLGTTTKAYLLGSSTTPTSSAQNVTTIADTGVYLGDTAGTLYAGNFYVTSTGKGYYLKDSGGNMYPGVCDNGTNLWIGSTATQATHHIGSTYISTGYNSTNSAGNPTIYISVPTAGNNNGTNYPVFHSGNFTTTGSGNAITSVAYDTNTTKLTFTKGSTFSLSTHTHTTLNVGTVGTVANPVYFSNGAPTACQYPSSGNWAPSGGSLPYISGSGVLEIGPYIDFHGTTSQADYDYRLTATTNGLTATSTGTYNVLSLSSPDYCQLRFQTTASGKAYTAVGIVAYPLTTSGMTMLLNCGGNMVVGGGESASTLYTNNYDNLKTTENESLYLGSDSGLIHFITGVGSNSQASARMKSGYFLDGDISWGGKDCASWAGPIDAAMNPVLGANRFELALAGGITIERSENTGSSWTTITTTTIPNESRRMFFSVLGNYIKITETDTRGMGTNAAKYLLRVTLDAYSASIYSIIYKLMINISTSGFQINNGGTYESGMYVKIYGRTSANVSSSTDTWVVWNKTSRSWVATDHASATEANIRTIISGWSGWNVINWEFGSGAITVGSSSASQIRQLRFVFGCDKNGYNADSEHSASTYGGGGVYCITGYGGFGWTAPSNLAKYGHIYTWDGNQNASFPAQITATKFNGASTKVVRNHVGNTTATTYSVLLGTNNTNTEDDTVKSCQIGMRTSMTVGSSSVNGRCELILGSASATGTANNMDGVISLYSTNTAGVTLKAESTTNWYTQTFPAVAGTVLNTGNYSSYALPLSGGTMTGTIKTPINTTVALDFRDAAAWHTTISYESGGNEALVFATKNEVTSMMFVSGEDSITNGSNTRWQSLTPALQVKQGKVAIGKLIGNSVTPTYQLEVASDIAISTATSGSPTLYFMRGVTTDGSYDWRLRGTGGSFYVEVCTGGSNPSWTPRATFPWDSNNLTVLGSVSLDNGTYKGTLTNSNGTAARTVILPDMSGQLAVMNSLNSTSTTPPLRIADAMNYKFFLVTVKMTHASYNYETTTIVPAYHVTPAVYIQVTFSSVKYDLTDSRTINGEIGIEYDPNTAGGTVILNVKLANYGMSIGSGGVTYFGTTSSAPTIYIKEVYGFAQ